MAIAWTAIENALAAWVKTWSDGLGTSTGPTAIWLNQAEPQPSIPYLTLKRNPPVALTLHDPITFTFNSSAPSGQEIAYQVNAQKEVTVVVEAFSNSVTAAGTAAEQINNLITSLRLPSVLAAFYAVGLSVRRRENVIDLSELVATAFQTRAQFELVLGLVDVQTDTPTGYIETVQITPTLDSVAYPEFTVTLD